MTMVYSNSFACVKISRHVVPSMHSCVYAQELGGGACFIHFLLPLPITRLLTSHLINLIITEEQGVGIATFT